MEKKHILGDLLVADDDPAMRDILSRPLRNDFNVLLAKDGTDALKLLETHKPVALLLDEMMPGAHGTEVLERARSTHPDAVRLLMTASTDFHAAVDAVNRGAIERFFSKPLRPMQLRNVLVEVVQARQREALLRVELKTLTDIKEQTAGATTVKLVLIGGDAALADVIQKASASRSIEPVWEHRVAQAPATLLQQSFDLVLLARGPDVDVPMFARLARSADENISVIVVDKSASLEATMEAYAIGVDDYLVAMQLSADEIGRRLERAAYRHVAQRDLRRVMSDVIIANRELAAARRQAEDEQVKVLNAMINALEARDPYTAGHTDRVASISVRLGDALGFDAARLERIRVGALLHDIGKIGVRDAVLFKPGRLNAEEFEQIKVHTTLGDEVLRDISQFKCVMPMIRHHHEKMDGSGYPDGLKGAAIPIEARVVAVADVMDALTSTRPYRDASGPETAFAIIDKMSGPHLDPDVVEALRDLHQTGRLSELLQWQGGAG